VGIPPHRSEIDISIPDDIVEEVLRIYGYDNLTPRMPEVELEPLRADTALRTQHKAQRLLACGHGFAEVHTYSWMDDNWLSSIGFDPGPTLDLANPTAQHQRRMRTSLMPNLLALIRSNRAHREEFRLFELGRTYLPASDNGREERSMLTGVSCSQSRTLRLEDHLRAVKGAVEDVAAALGCTRLTIPVSGATDQPWQEEGHWASVVADGREVGAFGALSGPLLDAVVPKGQVVWFDLDVAAMSGPIHPEVTFVPPPVYPGSWHDFTILWPAARTFAALEKAIDGFSHELILRRDFLYSYQGKGLAQGEAAYTFRYWIGSRDHTLSGEEIEGFRSGFLDFLESKGLKLR